MQLYDSFFPIELEFFFFFLYILNLVVELEETLLVDV